MGYIRVLSDQVANQIAAGEVVERPASVVKELLENSLDAGAQRIRIDVEAGGRKLIRITDDGRGMVRDDALLAFERHATSKIHSSDDLLRAATLGFRGEALPSIASVARVHLETRVRGRSRRARKWKLPVARFCGSPIAAFRRARRMEVRDLFFNTPARKKFLRRSRRSCRISRRWRPIMRWRIRQSILSCTGYPCAADGSGGTACFGAHFPDFRAR